MKGLAGPSYTQWDTDESGRIWLAENAPSRLASLTVGESTKLKVAQGKWTDLVNAWADFYGVSRSWVWGLMLAESGGDASAVSSVGALGLMQIMPMHAKGRDLLNPSVNLEIACGLIQQLRRGGWDLLEVASQYNAGAAKGGGPKRSERFDFGMVNEVGASQVPVGTVRRSIYLRTIAGGNNEALAGSPVKSSGKTSIAPLVAFAVFALAMGHK